MENPETIRESPSPQIMAKYWWDKMDSTEKYIFLMYLQSQGARISDNETKVQ